MERARLHRGMGLAQAASMVVGIIVGASIFVQPSEVNRHVPSAAGVIGVWLAAGVLTLFGSLACAELSSAYPRTGGVYVFLKETLSPALGFLWGWAMFWSAHSGIIAASAMILARYVAFFAPMGAAGIKTVAIAFILLLSLVNYLGVQQAGGLQGWVTAMKLAAIAILLALAAALGGGHAAAGAPVAAPFATGEFVLGVSAALFAFGGWHMVTYTAGETRDAARTVPRALLIGVCIVTLCYIGLNAAYLYILPIGRVIASQRVAADAALALAGPRGAAVISALVILSSVGVLNGVILAGPRAYYAMAEEGLAFHWLARAHPRYRTPYLAIALQAAWSCVLVVTGTYRVLFTRVVYTEWIFFALMTIGLLRLRRRRAPPFRVPGGGAIYAVFVLAAAAVAAIQMAAEPAQAAVGLALVVLGLPVYYFWIRPHAHR